MKKITFNKNKILASALSILGIGTLTACYGMPAPSESIHYIDGNVLGDIDGSGNLKPIQNIKVTDTSTGESVYTDSVGHYQLMTWISDNHSTSNIKINFEDVDGPKNGSFLSTEISINSEDDKVEDIILNK